MGLRGGSPGLAHRSEEEAKGSAGHGWSLGHGWKVQTGKSFTFGLVSQGYKARPGPREIPPRMGAGSPRSPGRALVSSEVPTPGTGPVPQCRWEQEG